MKKLVSLSLLIALLLSVGSAAPAETAATAEPAYAAFAQAIDMQLAEHVPDVLSSLGDNPDIGNRSAGSAAEKQAAEFIRNTFEEIGLQNITVDSFTCDNWSFGRGRIYYTDASGAEQFMLLGGYATHLTLDKAPVTVVYAGRGTEADYEGLDVEGKVVLIDIDQSSDWWIEIPAIEAHNRGALCVLACNVSGYAQYDDDTIGSQDFCGPYDVPTFGVSKNTSATLQALIAQGGGEAEVMLDVESIVTTGGESQNVWGEIPGKTDEVIYLMAHYDGYYHSYFDDAIGVGYLCSIAKAMVDSGYLPDKTLRFIAHGAEEWGKTDTEYDWAIGAFKQITEVHPEWAENAFALLNLDGMYPITGHVNFTVKAVYELQDFAAGLMDAVYGGTDYGCTLGDIPGCWTEDFGYTRAGVPSIVTGGAKEDTYHVTAYHASMDNKVLGVDMEAYALGIRMFGRYALELDRLAVRPMDFAARFAAMREVYTGDAVDFDAATEAADAASAKIADINARYQAAIDAGDAETAAVVRAEGIELNAALFKIYRHITGTMVAFDWEDNLVFTFEQNDWNIEALEAAIACLEDGDAVTPVDDLLYAVDYNWYAYDFSRETYDYCVEKMYDKAAGTWGEGMIQRPNQDLYDVIHSLMEKGEAADADLTAELDALNQALETQLQYRAELDAELAANMQKVIEMLAAAAK